MEKLAAKIFGILNISEDSFFDGKLYLEPQKAKQHALTLKQQGAWAIDLGAAASNPSSKEVTPELEIQRLSQIIPFLRQQNCIISVDSFQPAVQLYALKQKVEFLNDISGFGNAEIYAELAKANCSLILMHSVQRKGKADKRNIEPTAIVDLILDFFTERIATLQKAGIHRKRIILDPGLGFFLSDNPETSFTVLKNLKTFKKIFQLPILLGISRKSFLQKKLQNDSKKIGAAGAYLELLMSKQGCDYIRTHSPELLNDLLKLDHEFMI